MFSRLKPKSEEFSTIEQLSRQRYAILSFWLFHLSDNILSYKAYIIL